jgi:hypothetical protein
MMAARKHKYRVVTSRGGYMVFAVNESAARRQLTRRGYTVQQVKPYRYTPPTPPC